MRHEEQLEERRRRGPRVCERGEREIGYERAVSGPPSHGHTKRKRG